MITLTHINRRLLSGTAIVLSCFLMIGCEYFPESTFKLADDSRLPRGVTLPPGLTRADVSLTMNYYIKPWGRSARFQLQDTKERILKTVDGKVQCREPFQLKTPAEGFSADYPAFQAITVNGITDIIEHKKMEPIFYVTDDIAVWKQYRAIGCG